MQRKFGPYRRQDLERDANGKVELGGVGRGEEQDVPAHLARRWNNENGIHESGLNEGRHCNKGDIGDRRQG